MQKDLGADLAELRADGGASRNGMLMQFQADLIDRPVSVGNAAEVSALGAAALAFEGLGHRSRSVEATSRFDAVMPEEDRAVHLARWQRAVRQTLAS